MFLSILLILCAKIGKRSLCILLKYGHAKARVSISAMPRMMTLVHMLMSRPLICLYGEWAVGSFGRPYRCL